MNARDKALFERGRALGRMEGYDEGSQKTAAEYMRLLKPILKESEKNEPGNDEEE